MTRARVGSSLFARLLLGFLGVMLGIWLCNLAWNVYELDRNTRADIQSDVKTWAQQLLVTANASADHTERIPALIDQTEAIRIGMLKERAFYQPQVEIQVWQGDRVLYSKPTGLAKQVPNEGAGDPGKRRAWVSWTEVDSNTHMIVSVGSEVTGRWLFTFDSMGYYFLPILYSFPLLLLPAWFIIRVGLRPLKLIVSAIEERSASDLKPLALSPYKELSPLVESVNALMARLTQSLEREREFLLDAAHELKTPLAVIQINADSMVASPDEKRLHEAHSGLSQGVARATHTVHQLLALARSDLSRSQEDLQAMDLVELLRDRMALAAFLALRRDIEIELNAPERCECLLHRESMAALIDNLLSNAIKYSPDRGHIFVTLVASSEKIVMHILDEGPGIPVELRQQVFERFYRCPGQDQPGSGLGLAIVERAAQRNRAQVNLGEGEGGKGLLVTVQFTQVREAE